MQANRIGLGVTVALHALLLAALLSYEPARKTLLAVVPIMVELIVPPKFEAPKLEPLKPQPPAELPKPRPMAKKPAERSSSTMESRRERRGVETTVWNARAATRSPFSTTTTSGSRATPPPWPKPSISTPPPTSSIPTRAS